MSYPETKSPLLLDHNEGSFSTARKLGAWLTHKLSLAENPYVLLPSDAQAAEQSARDPHDAGEMLNTPAQERLKALLVITRGQIKRL